MDADVLQAPLRRPAQQAPHVVHMAMDAPVRAETHQVQGLTVGEQLVG